MTLKSDWWLIHNIPLISCVPVTEVNVALMFQQQMHGHQHLPLRASGAARVCCSSCCYCGQHECRLLLPLWLASMLAEPPAWCLWQNVFPAPMAVTSRVKEEKGLFCTSVLIMSAHWLDLHCASRTILAHHLVNSNGMTCKMPLLKTVAIKAEKVDRLLPSDLKMIFHAS